MSLHPPFLVYSSVRHLMIASGWRRIPVASFGLTLLRIFRFLAFLCFAFLSVLLSVVALPCLALDASYWHITRRPQL